MAFFCKHELPLDLLPHKCMNAYLPVKKSKRQKQNDGSSTIVKWFIHTNLEVALLNTGTGGITYPGFRPFGVKEMMKHIGGFFNRVSPSPQVEMKFNSQEKTN